MSRQIRLYQISQKTNAISVKGILWAENGNLLQIVKKHGGVWNVALSQFQIALQNTGNLIKDIKNIDQNLIIKDVPTPNIRSILFQAKTEDERRMSWVQPKCKKNRVLVYDPFLVQRYEFIKRYLMPTAKITNTFNPATNYKRILLICCQKNCSQWDSQIFSKLNIYNKVVDYEALSSDVGTLSNAPLTEHEINVLTYEKLPEYLFTKKALQKYHSIICDDCQCWFNGLAGVLSSHDISVEMRKILKEYFSHEKDMVLITGLLNLDNIWEILQICNILKPKQYGCDALEAVKYDGNDATWMKKRYVKDNKFGRELLYVLENSVLVNLSKFQAQKEKRTPKSAPIENRIYYTSEEIGHNIKIVDNKFKSVNKKAVLSSFQNQRISNSYSLSDASKMEEAKYLKQLRDVMIADKWPLLTKHLYHLVKVLGQRAVLVLETVATFEKVAKFLTEQQVAYIVYEITCEGMRKISYTKFNASETHRLCILVRDKLIQQYKKCKNQWERQLEEAIQRQAERELGIAEGHLFELALHNRSKLNNPLFRKDQMIQLPKIVTARHLIIFDTYWYDFSAEKEDIISNILNFKVPFFQETISLDQTAESSQQAPVYKRIEPIKHYFINKNTIQKQIIQKYMVNLKAHEEAEQLPSEEKEMSLQDFTKNLLDQQTEKCRDKKIITGVYDVDQEYDDYEYQNRKGQLQDDDQPVYNTHIPGLVIETPCLPVKKEIEENEHNQIQMIPQKKEALANIQWLNDDEEQEDEDDSSSEDGLDLRRYLAQPPLNEQISEEYLGKIEAVEKMQPEREEKDDNEEDSIASSICLEMKDKVLEQEINESDATLRKDSFHHRQKLTIEEPPQVILLDEDSNSMLPLQIVQNTRPGQKQPQLRIPQLSSNYSLYPHPAQGLSYSGASKHNRQRMPPTSGFKMWGRSGKKIIAPKSAPIDGQSLKILLKPTSSFIRQP